MKTARLISALAVVAITIVLACSCGQRQSQQYRVWQICGDTCDSVSYPITLRDDTAKRVAWFGSDGRLYRAERVAR